MSKWLLNIIIWLGLFISGFFLAKSNIKTLNPITITETIQDTIYIQTKPQIIWKTAMITKIIRDTVCVVNNDTIIINSDIDVAIADTIFNEGYLKAQYFFLPLNKFKFDWNPNPKEIIVKTEYIKYIPKWYEKKELWGITGLLIGAYVRSK